MTVDLAQINQFSDLPLDVMLGKMFYSFGWIPIAIILLWGAKEIWLVYIRQKWYESQKYIFKLR